jgi:DNA repair photolyase
MASKVTEIEAKVLLSHCRDPDSWFGVMYNMNLYRGCEHHCIYCDSRSACYQIEDFDGELLVKANAIDLLRKELASKRVKGTVGTGAMQDPYTPSEAKLEMTGQALDVIAQMRYPVHILTKSDLVLRDVDRLVAINRTYASVCFTITTADDALGKLVEPGAPAVSRRLRAARELVDHGIQVGVALMPVLPYIEDSEENITQIVGRAHEAGVSYVVPWFGMSLRNRQREHFYAQLDAHFPGLRRRYEARYGDRYSCPVPNARRLSAVFHRELARYGMGTRVQPYRPKAAEQLSLFS